MKIYLFILIQIAIAFNSKAQKIFHDFEKYIYRYKDSSEVNRMFVKNKLPAIVNSLDDSFILILSEHLHRFYTSNSLFRDIIAELENMRKMNCFLIELPFVDIESFKVSKKDERIVKVELSDFWKLDSGWLKRNELSYLNEVEASRRNFWNEHDGTISIHGFDIGLSTLFNAYKLLLSWTKESCKLCFENNDSLLYRLSRINPENIYQIFEVYREGVYGNDDINEILARLIKYTPGDSFLIRSWQNILNTIEYKRQSSKYSWIIQSNDFKVHDTIMWAKFEQREKYMADNVFWILGNKKKLKIVLRVSSYHSLWNYNGKNEFLPVLNTLSRRTFGQYINERLQDKYKIYRIAFVVYRHIPHRLSRYVDVKKPKNNQRASMEYYLRNSDFAYVDFEAIRNDTALSKRKFYMNPTFSEFVCTDWQNIYDGIFFIRDNYKYKDKSKKMKNADIID